MLIQIVRNDLEKMSSAGCGDSCDIIGVSQIDFGALSIYCITDNEFLGMSQSSRMFHGGLARRSLIY
jgi:hypothetical protein